MIESGEIPESSSTFSHLTPKHLRNLKAPKMNATAAEKKRYEEACNERDIWRYVLNSNNVGRSKNSPDGYRQFQCPIHAGRMRVTNKGFEWTYRKAGRNTPEVTLPPGTTSCCKQRFITLAATDIPRFQKLPLGTTAQSISMNRRLIVENGNAKLQS